MSCVHGVCGLQYVEEPAASLADSLRFSAETGIPIALDETLDQACAAADGAKLGELLSAALPWVSAAEGVAAVVLKPGALGGFERTAQVAAWAGERGMQVWDCGTAALCCTARCMAPAKPHAL